MSYSTTCAGRGRVQSPESCPEGWVPAEAGAGRLDTHCALFYPTAPLMRRVPYDRAAYPNARVSLEPPAS